MTKVKVFPGPCGFEAEITAEKDGKHQVRMTVESKCPAVKALGEKLPLLTMRDIVGKGGFGAVRPFEVATGTLFHATCPVLCGYLKAAEAEMGLAVHRDVVLEIKKES
ncbi:MAG: hypothetical protein KQJ78_19245 [Deltaproteobacteria bacterium]|nr:hypothetical protein [Deltaproteobacteria bacterium]